MLHAQNQMDPFSVPMVFCRIGWMDRYEGQESGDEIKGGGSFVETHGFGYEIYNFKKHQGRVYGYVTSRGTGDVSTPARVNINRIGAWPKTRKDPSISGVLVIWVSQSPVSKETVIVGWYRNATVYRSAQNPPPGSDRNYRGRVLHYFATADASDGILLLNHERLFSIPLLKDEMGQSHVWYAANPEVHGKFRREVLAYIANRQLLEFPDGEDGGFRRQPDPFLRQQVEDAAVEETRRHFTEIGYTVDSFEKDNVGWDLEAIKGRELLRLEVKGFSGSDVCVELTPNEYGKMQMQRFRDSYRICVVTNALTDPMLSISDSRMKRRTGQIKTDECS